MKTQSQVIHAARTSNSSFNAVYRQCWPHPSSFQRQLGLKIHHKSPMKGHQPSQSHSDIFESSFSPEDLTSSVPLRKKILQSRGGHDKLNASSRQGQESKSLHEDLGLDQGTLHWKTWRNFRDDLENANSDAELYKITQDTFRQLTRHVREVSMQMNNKYSRLKSYSIRPSQLSASLPAHSPSIQDHREWTNQGTKPSVEIKCTAMKRAERRRPQSHSVRSLRRQVVTPARPKSSQLSSETQGKFDHLSPKILGKFTTDLKETESQDSLGPFEIVTKGYLKQFSEFSDSDEEADEVSKELSRSQYSMLDLENIRWDRFRQEKEYMQKKLLGVKLLPEVFNPEDSFFEYRSSNASSPEPDPLPEVLSEPYCYMDLLELSQEKDWRQAVRKVPEERDVEIIMDRLIEMERFQEDTSRLERKESLPSKKATSQLEEKKGWTVDAAKPTERARNNLSKVGSKSKNCSNSCLRPACGGDCKPVVESKGCLHCRGRHCKGQCTEYGYHLHVRQPRDVDKRKPRPKSCASCSKSGTKVLNTVNANNIILGRPRSAFSTFSRVQQIRRSKQSARMSYTSENDGGLISQRLKELQLHAPMERESTKDETGRSTETLPRRAKSARPHKGRDALLSGKAYNSQRRISITTEVCSTSAARCNSPALRAQSAKLRRRRVKSAKR